MNANHNYMTTITVRVSDQEKAAVQRRARELKISPSALVRTLITEKAAI